MSANLFAALDTKKKKSKVRGLPTRMNDSCAERRPRVLRRFPVGGLSRTPGLRFRKRSGDRDIARVRLSDSLPPASFTTPFASRRTRRRRRRRRRRKEGGAGKSSGREALGGGDERRGTSPPGPTATLTTTTSARALDPSQRDGATMKPMAIPRESLGRRTPMTTSTRSTRLRTTW